MYLHEYCNIYLWHIICTKFKVMGEYNTCSTANPFLIIQSCRLIYTNHLTLKFDNPYAKK